MKLYSLFGIFAAGLVLGAIGGYLATSQAHKGVPEMEISDPQKLRGEILPSSAAGKKIYKSTTPSFSLSYPEELSVKEFDEGQGATTIVFQGPGEENGFQLFITPYREAQISEARIKQDLKGATMKDSKEIILAGNVRATLFTSESPIIGESREVWFIHDGYLYEATTYAAWEGKLAEILGTLEF